MKKYIQILFACTLMISPISLMSQENLPLKFQEDVIKWSELSWMEGQPSNDQWIYMSSPPRIFEDTLFLFMKYYQKEPEDGRNYGHCGYIIKKMNITTGEKYWELSRKYKEYGNRKTISHPNFLDGVIEVAIYDEPLTNRIETDWQECYPGHFTLDRKTGEVIDSNYVDKTNTAIPKLRSFGNLYLAGDTRPTIYKIDDGYLHVRRAAGLLDRTLLNLNGTEFVKDSIFYPPNIFNRRSSFFSRIENDSIWLLMLSSNADWSEIQVLFTKYDQEFNRDTMYDVSKHFKGPYSGGGIYFIDKGYFVVETNYQNNVDSTFKFHSTLFDHNGDFVDSISYVLRPGIDNIIRFGWLRPLVDRVNNRLLMTQSRQNSLSEESYFELYENTAEGIRPIKRITVEGRTDIFRTFNSTMLDNGDILLYIEQLTDPGADADRWFSWILLDGEKMNITTSTDEVTLGDTQNTLRLYPNPTTGLVQIKNLAEPASVRIYRITGELVRSLEDVRDQIQISDLPSGMYIFDIRNKTISERHKIVKTE